MFGIQSKSAVPYQLTLDPNQVFRLPQSSHSVQVLSGTAWITIAGKDIILASNEAALLLPHQHIALISALNKQRLLLKVL